jgi:diadenosine tetraphosphatase ApaH/serine/threonine PP2A family protein phosphatase
VLADAGDADEFVLGGDYALAGAWPRETVERLKGLPNATWIRGNVDRWAGGDVPAGESHLEAAVEDTRAALGDALADEIGRLPTEAEVAGARFVHASPVSDMRAFSPQPNGDDEELLGGTTHPRVVFGHIHIQFRRPAAVGDIELVNPGSVGVPLDGDPRAAYALIDPDTRELELRRVEYDTQATIDKLRETYGDREWAPAILRRLETQQP